MYLLPDASHISIPFYFEWFGKLRFKFSSKVINTTKPMITSNAVWLFVCLVGAFVLTMRTWIALKIVAATHKDDWNCLGVKRFPNSSFKLFEYFYAHTYLPAQNWKVMGQDLFLNLHLCFLLLVWYDLSIASCSWTDMCVACIETFWTLEARTTTQQLSNTLPLNCK